MVVESDRVAVLLVGQCCERSWMSVLKDLLNELYTFLSPMFLTIVLPSSRTLALGGVCGEAPWRSLRMARIRLGWLPGASLMKLMDYWRIFHVEEAVFGQ